MSVIPVIDVSPLFTDDEAGFKKVSDEIDRAARQVGFFYIKNHSISKQHIDKIRNYSETFFGQSLEQKEQIAMGQNTTRGYGDAAKEQLDARKPFDNKETFNMGYNLPGDDPELLAGLPLRGCNVHPDIDGWEDFFENHYQAMVELGKTLLRAMTPHLGVERTHFEDMFARPLSVFRLLHYPAVDNPSVTAGAHTDYGCITLLYQDNVGGLQVVGANGEWVDATPIEGTFVVNIGDMLARWSNDRYKSTTHRVLATPNVERYSFPFFLEPSPETNIECLPACQDSEHPPKYPAISAQDHLLERFRATYSHFDDGSSDMTAAATEVAA